MSSVISGREFINKLAEIVGVNPSKTRRIVIDCNIDSAVVVFVEMYGTDELLELEYPKDMTVNIVGNKDEH